MFCDENGAERRPVGAEYGWRVITLERVAEMAMELPGVTEGRRYQQRTWFVGPNGFAWERPFSKADIKRFGDVTPPDGPIVALRVEDLGDKEAVLAAHPAFFTIPHFDGYPAFLVQLRAVPVRVMREAVFDSWAVVAPEALVHEQLAARRRRR
jgi:hypothetical protein